MFSAVTQLNYFTTLAHMTCRLHRPAPQPRLQLLATRMASCTMSSAHCEHVAEPAIDLAFTRSSIPETLHVANVLNVACCAWTQRGGGRVAERGPALRVEWRFCGPRCVGGGAAGGAGSLEAGTACISVLAARQSRVDYLHQNVRALPCDTLVDISLAVDTCVTAGW